VTSYDLDKFILTLQFHLALVAGTGAWTSFQRSNEQAPVYELLPYILWLPLSRKTSQNMNVQSSPGINPFSNSFIKHAEKTVQDDRGKRYTEHVCFPFLLNCSICSCQTVSPHIFGTESKLRLYTKNSNYVPQKLSSAGY
jgi:hypothetical protein